MWSTPPSKSAIERSLTVSGLILLACLAAAGWAREQPREDLPNVAARQLPPEAQHTLALIRQGGPFPYSKDGAVFHNREGKLPRAARGYYREYTVEMPGSGDRGARRIIQGRHGELFYTDDHYRTFFRLRQ